MNRNVRIIGTGKYLPPKVVSAEELDQHFGLPEGTVFRKSGVKYRHQIEGETASQMAAKAIHQALTHAGLTLDDIDCIVATSGTYEQPIPSNASLIKEELGLKNNIPAFDFNSTCLSFVVGLDVISYLVDAGRYQRVVLVSSDITSVGINYNHLESSVLFGDGAAAVIIEQSQSNQTSKILSARIETYMEGVHYTEIRGGGNKMHSKNHSPQTKEEFLFAMNGRAVFKLSSKVMDGFMKELFKEETCTLKDIDMVIPHQASGKAMELMRLKLGIEKERFMNIIADHGNVVAASIPMALNDAIMQNRVKRGDRVMLVGTSAGLSLGGLILVY